LIRSLCLLNVKRHERISIMLAAHLLHEVTISPGKIYYGEKKRIALYSSAHTLCGVYLGLGLL